VIDLDQNGERFDFTKYVFNVFNKTESQFISFIENNASDFAEEACHDEAQNLDFVAISGIEFDNEDEQ
jgi:hypothetical protein